MKGMLRVVLDTNVIYSALRSGGKPMQLLRMVLHHDGLVACLSTALLLEYEEKLIGKLADINAARAARQEPTLNRREIVELLNNLTDASCLCAVHQWTRPSLTDPDDEMVLELALAAPAVLCTGNKRDFAPAVNPYRIILMTPAELLRALRL